MRQQVREVPVVGYENQSLAGPVEPADGEQPPLAGHEVHDPRPPRRVVVGRHDSHGLIEHVHDPLGIGQSFAIDANLLRERIDADSQFGDDLPIDLDPTRRDQLLAAAAAAEAGGGQEFLQPLLAVVGGRGSAATGTRATGTRATGTRATGTRATGTRATGTRAGGTSGGGGAGGAARPR
jgi:hypothetical protein